MRVRRFAFLIFLVACWLWPVMTWAQSATTGAIAGVVKDSTGGVVPGVAVEATSPALIERVRVTVSDDAGQYRIVDLRPGTYSLRFSLRARPPSNILCAVFASVRDLEGFEGCYLNSGIDAVQHTA